MNLFIANIQGNSALIVDTEAHHLQKVLRKEEGDLIYVTDGIGNLFSGIIDTIQSKKVVIINLESVKNFQARNYQVSIAIAPTKQMDRTEFFVEKGVEIGLDKVIPILTFHSERRKINHERLNKIAISAMKQSLKAELPKIMDLTTFDQCLQDYKQFSGQKFIAHCDESIIKSNIKSIIKPNNDYIFLIGPEGDFSTEEINSALEHGFESITLGRQRMRTETAALSCVMGVHWLHEGL